MARNIGVLSDTHGLLRDEVRSRLQGCDMIIHAGDLGSEAVLAELRQMAEVVAVRGNVDRGRWAWELKEVEYADVEGRRICVLHDIDMLDRAAAVADIVVYGHSHTPAIERRDGILYLNPGSAGPKRFHRSVSMAFLHVTSEGASAELIELPV